MSERSAIDIHTRLRRAKRALRLALLYTVLSAIGLTMVLPFLWMLSTSLKTEKAAVEIPPSWVPRDSATYANYGGREVRVGLLKKTATVRRLDNGQELTVYQQALSVRKPWFGGAEQTYASIRQNDATVYVPVTVISTLARVRVLDEGPEHEKVVDLPGEAVFERSSVSPQWSNYPTTWGKLPFGRSYINTSIVTIAVTLGQVLTCSLAAFAFARLRFPGRDKLFMGYLATMMIPGAVTLIPVYILFIKMPELLNYIFQTDWFSSDLYFLGKYYVGRLVGGNSYFALIAPGLFSAYGTFMLRQFFMGLPRELEDAARIDGCGNLRIYWHVTMPLSRVAIATLATFTFMGTWKAFMWPLLILNTEELVPLQVLLQRFQGQYGSEHNLLMAGSIIVLLPLLAVFILGQRYFVKGIQLGGVKG
ncbi:MAG: carbohydrate ABC transporter permease [Phycisphaerae bacterium]